MTDSSILKAIEDVDPDGGNVEPTVADYTNFENWVVARYGAQAMTDYYHRQHLSFSDNLDNHMED